MSFFGDLEKKINQTGQNIANKANNIADSSKLNFKISAEEKALTDLYRQLGSAYFTHLGKNPDERLEPLCSSIAQKLELLASLREQEAAARGKRLCPGCGSECDIHQPFCYVCHTELTPAPPPGMQRCSSCGQNIPQEAMFCTYCGTKVASDRNP